MATISGTSVMGRFQIVVEVDRSVKTQRDAVVFPNVSQIENSFGRCEATKLFCLTYSCQDTVGRLFPENGPSQNDNTASAGI